MDDRAATHDDATMRHLGRRAFLRAAARAAIAGAVGFVAALAMRRARDGADETSCARVSPCRGCARLKSCALPRAAAARRAVRK